MTISSILKKFSLVAAGTVALTVSAGEAAQAINLKTTVFGLGDNLDPDPQNIEFQVDFLEGVVGQFVETIIIDLQAGLDTDAIFNPGLNPGGAGPSILSLTGLAIADVTFSPAFGAPSSPQLEIGFAAGSFAAGDSLSFSIDVDNLDGSGTTGFDSGGAFGLQEVGLQVLLEGGGGGTTSFFQVSDTQSVAAVPEPLTILGSLSAVGVGAILKKKQKKA